jgi:hypothetical protein
MTTVNEATIRDSLADNLHLLEKGLTLIQKEYPLKNPIGSKGYVDILARDSFGNRVVIEVKRSDPASRQAIHEIFKYFALYKTQNQTPDHQLRCFVVSTTWRELRVPFDEFLRKTTLQAQGFQIEVDLEGVVIAAEGVKPLAPQKPFSLFRSHDIYLFKTPAKRDAFLPIVSDTFAKCGGLGGLLITADYEGDSDRVVAPFAAYLVTSKVSDESAKKMTAACLEEDPDFDPTTAEGRNTFEDEFSLMIQATALKLADTFEGGSPEKFGAECENGWKAKSVIRLGDVPDVGAVSDGELITLVAGYGGDNSVLYHRIATPRIPLAWQSIPQEFELSLRGNTAWLAAAEWFLDWVKQNLPDATVSICIYNPMDLIITMFQFLRGQSEFVPYLEIVATDEAKSRTVALFGRILWNGLTRPTSIRDVFTPGIGGLDAVRMHTHMRSSWQIDETLLSRHGLYYGLLLGEDRGSGMIPEEIRVVNEGGRIVQQKATADSKGLVDFFTNNFAYLAEFGEDMARSISL